MAWTLDARIPVTVLADEAALAAALADGGGAAAVLAEGLAPALPAGAVAVVGFDPNSHQIGCDCGVCGTGRGPAATALDQLFQARVRGSVPWFTRLVAWVPSPQAHDSLEDALRSDAVTRARFRRVHS